jgi:hypothetical protein
VDEPSIAANCRQSVHFCPPVAITLSTAIEPLTVKSPSHRQLLSIAILRPSLLSCRCIVHGCPRHRAVYHHQIAIAPSTVHCCSASITNVL